MTPSVPSHAGRGSDRLRAPRRTIYRCAEPFLVYVLPPVPRCSAAPPAPGFGRQRFGAGGPDAERRLHADHIGQTAGRDAGAERAVGAIPSVGQQDARSDACCQRGPDLSEGDLGLGPEFHFVRDTNLLAPRLVPSPVFRQIQPIGDRQAGGVIGDRKRHRDLTIVGLAEPPAILPRDATLMERWSESFPNATS